MSFNSIVMNRIFLITVIAASMVLFYGCSKMTNETSTNAQSQAQSTPVDVSQFSDANEALAAGNQLLENNKTEEAIQVFLRATELNPDLGEAWFKLGIAYSLVEKEQKVAAMEDVNAVENTNSKKPPATESEKAFKKAVEAYNRLLDQNPDDDVSQFNLGRALNKLNEDQDAAKALKQAVKLKPEDSEYQTELGAILIKLAQYQEAIPPLNKALEIDPDNSRASELLEDAQAGRARVEYSQPKKDTDKAANANMSASNSNTAANANTEQKNANQSKTTIPGKAPTPDIKKTPKPANRPD
jgi:tetratricopeptide (TPR) repeat protein